VSKICQKIRGTEARNRNQRGSFLLLTGGWNNLFKDKDAESHVEEGREKDRRGVKRGECRSKREI